MEFNSTFPLIGILKVRAIYISHKTLGGGLWQIESLSTGSPFSPLGFKSYSLWQKSVLTSNASFSALSKYFYKIPVYSPTYNGLSVWRKLVAYCSTPYQRIATKNPNLYFRLPPPVDSIGIYSNRQTKYKSIVREGVTQFSESLNCQDGRQQNFRHVLGMIYQGHIS